MSSQVNLTSTSCSDNLLKTIKLPVVGQEKLTHLNLYNNNFSRPKNSQQSWFISNNQSEEQDLSFLESFINLETLWLGNKDEEKINRGIYNRFGSSLEPLKNMKNLKSLRIENTDIHYGLEYLPLENLFDKRLHARVDQIFYALCDPTHHYLDKEFWKNNLEKFSNFQGETAFFLQSETQSLKSNFWEEMKKNYELAKQNKNLCQKTEELEQTISSLKLEKERLENSLKEKGQQKQSEINQIKRNYENELEDVNNELLETKKKQLDTLARLLTGRHKWDRTKKDTCVAVCYHEGKLFVASNKKKAEYPQEYINYLQEFINTQSSKSFENLLKKAVEKIYHTSLLEQEQISDISDKVSLNEYLRKIEECNNSLTPDWNGLQKLAEKLFQEVQKLPEGSSEKNQKWKYLIPWYDVENFISLILGNKNNELRSIIEKQESKVIYIESEDEEENPKQKKTHAELKIINKLYRKKLIGEPQETRYIGSTKKTCSHCQAVINIFNNDKYQWISYGSHGSNETKGKNPKIVTEHNKEKEVEDLTKEVEKNFAKDNINSLVHTTSEIPDILTNPAQILVQLQFQEQLAQIEITPK